MNLRFREARKARGMTQDDVAASVRTSRGVVVNAELGRSTTADWYISAFCRSLGISETWLRTGEGPMDAASESDVRELAEAVARECGGNDVFRALVEVYLQMDQAGRDALARMVRLVSERLRRGESAYPLPTAEELEANEVFPSEANEKSGAP